MLFALALLLFAALPCALAAEDTCCGGPAACEDTGAAPCAQLGATPCCENEGAPLERTTPPATPAWAPVAFVSPVAPFAGPPQPQRPAAALRDDLSIRRVVLRL